MQQIITQFTQQLYQLYQKAQILVDEQRSFRVSEKFLNATIERFVTDNLSFIQDLHLDLYDNWLRLSTTLEFSGNHFELYVDLALVKLEFNQHHQLFVFKQISDTHIVDAQFAVWWQKWAAYSLLFFYQRLLQKDPLGKILEHYRVVSIKDGLLHLDLMRWLGRNPSIIDALSKVHIHHGILHENELELQGQAYLDELLHWKQKFTMDHAPLDISNLEK